MKIDSIKLKNFRGYRSETEINFNDLTVFVGKNDIGKSKGMHFIHNSGIRLW